MSKLKAISCVIVDDEITSQRVLEHFIEETPVLSLKATCTSAAEAFKYLQLHPSIDLMFLDINMPQQSGLDFYKSLKQAPKVIFTTAYPQFAVDGFEVNAIDYLLKPIAYERFLTAVNKVLAINGTIEKEDDYILLKENKAIHKVLFENILYVEAFGDYVKVHSKSKTVVTHSTFSKVILQLPDQFLRTHKSFSINMDHMSHLAGNQIFVHDKAIPIGQTFKKSVLKALDL